MERSQELQPLSCKASILWHCCVSQALPLYIRTGQSEKWSCNQQHFCISVFPGGSNFQQQAVHQKYWLSTKKTQEDHEGKQGLESHHERDVKGHSINTTKLNIQCVHCKCGGKQNLSPTVNFVHTCQVHNGVLNSYERHGSLCKCIREIKISAAF